ncbi:actin-1/3, partial [Plakobranchus ocellatus]
ASHQGIQHLIKSADREALLGGDATVNMIDLPDTYASVDTDMNAYELLRRHDIRGRLLLTPGDGNCLFNSISIILICNTKMASELRYKTCIQMATRKDRVLEGHRNIDDLFIVSPDYDESLIACARATELSSAWTILGLSQVLQHKVISVYPPENGPSYEAVRILTTEFGSFQHELPLSILLMGPKKGKGKMWLPNHFLPIAPESSDDDAAHDDEKQTEDGVCGGCDDDVLNDDGNVYEVDTGVDDYHADNDNNQIDNNRRDGEEEETIKVTSSQTVLHDGDETETDDETHDGNVGFEGKPLSRDNFLPFNEVLDLLTGDTLETMHASAFLGRKENVWFWVDNEDNVIRRKGGKKSHYWNDYGAWGNGAKANTPSTLYTRQNGLAMHVVKREGKYCQEKQSNGKKVYKAVEPQPASEDVFKLRRNYSKHAHSNDYVRRVTWLEERQRRCL